MTTLTSLTEATAIGADDVLYAVVSGADRKVKSGTLIGAGISSAATISALEALSVTGRPNGSLVYVQGYNAAADGGGGLFRWDAASTAASDGISVFVPTSLQSAEQTNSVSVAALRPDREPPSLSNANVIFGSVELVYSDGTGTAASGSFVTDIEMHGHALPFALDGTSTPLPHDKLFDHATGAFVRDGESDPTPANRGLRRLYALATAHLPDENQSVDCRYKYATGAGRWVRVVGSHVTPAMIGCVPDDATENNADRLAWLMNWCAANNTPILLDAIYYYKGTIELPDGIVIEQQRPHSEAGLKVCPWSTIPAIDHLAISYDDTLPPAKLEKEVCVIIVGGNAENITLRGVCIHGNVENNDDFLTDGDYDSTALSGTVSQNLRESPTYCGFAVTIQNSRPVSDYLKVYLQDVQIGDFGGSCLLAPGHQRWFVGRNVRLGVSVSGRVKYGGSGDWQNLWLYGYSRTAVERGYNQTSHTHRYTWERPDGTSPTRIWSANAVPDNLTATFGDDQDRADHLPSGSIFSGVDWDFTGSDLTSGFNCRGMGNSITGRMETPGGAVNFRPLLCPYSDAEAKFQVEADLVVFNRSTSGVTPLDNRSDGGWHIGSNIKMRIVEVYDDSGNPSQTATTLPTEPSCSGPEVYVGKLKGTEEAINVVERQDISLNIFSELAHSQVIDLVGLAGSGQTVTASDYMPTTIRLSGQILNVSNKLFKAANGQGPASGLSVIPVRVFADSLTFRVYDPGTSFVGDTGVLDACFEIFKMRNCSTPEGWVSEQSGSIDIAGSDLTTYQYDISTNLLWRPQVLSVVPTSADAATYFSHAEVITSGAGSSENAIQPTIRLHFANTTPSGAAITMMWSAAVSPY